MKRKPTPVDVVYFAKRPRRVSQTIPEVLVRDLGPVTEVEVPAVAPPARKRTRSVERASTPTASAGLSDMAALGHELFSLGKVHEARVVFEGLLVANPRDSFALTMVGTVYLSLHDLDKALAAFERALEVDPNDVAARVYRGEIRLNRHRTKAALEDFTRALKVAQPNDPFADRARRLMKLGRRTSRG